MRQGMDIIVHSSMKSFGYVVNGAHDVIDSILEVVDPACGTLLMPSHTGQMTDPSSWKKPAIPADAVQRIRSSMLPFSVNRTPVRNRGVVSSTFLNYPAVMRSNHPLNSVAALGRRSAYYTEKHSFHEPEGRDSPVGRLYDNNGYCLLLGVGLEQCTVLHLAEYIANVDYLYHDNPTVLKGRVNGVNEFIRIKKYPSSSKMFGKMMRGLLERSLISKVDYHGYLMILFKVNDVVDFVVEKLSLEPEYLIRE